MTPAETIFAIPFRNMTLPDGQPHQPDPLTALQQALQLGSETRVDDSLYFGVRGQSQVMVFLEEKNLLRILIEMGNTANLTATHWAELVRAWSSQFGGAQAGQPLVLDDTLWLTLTVSVQDDTPAWLTRVQHFLAQASQIKITVLMPSAGMQ